MVTWFKEGLTNEVIPVNDRFLKDDESPLEYAESVARGVGKIWNGGSYELIYIGDDEAYEKYEAKEKKEDRNTKIGIVLFFVFYVLFCLTISR